MKRVDKEEHQIRRNITMGDKLAERAREVARENGHSGRNVVSTGIRIALEAYCLKSENVDDLF